MEFSVSPPNATESLVKRMFYLAWQACGGPAGMGWLQDRGPDVSEEDVWEAIVGQADYPGMSKLRPLNPLHPYADYVMGRMMKMGLDWSIGSIRLPESRTDIEYQAWCGRYPTYEALAQAAASEVKATLAPADVTANT